MSFEKSLTDALITTEHDELIGPIPVNVTDALLGIAAAINRLAASQEKLVEANALQFERAAQSAEMVRRMVMLRAEDGPGHA